MGTSETEQVGESFRGVFLDESESRGSFVDVDVGVKDRENQFCGYTGGVCRGVELTYEALVPCVDGVLKDLLDLS